MRFQTGSDYVVYIRWVLDPNHLPVLRARMTFWKCDLRTFDSVAEMRVTVIQRNEQDRLSRMGAYITWNWKSKSDKGDLTSRLAMSTFAETVRQRETACHPRYAVQEVGSIHTVQSYDLKYVGVIIGPDLRFDLQQGQLYIERESHAEQKGHGEQSSARQDLHRR